MKLYLVRHGQSEANVDYKILAFKKDEYVSLTDKGKEQALEVGKKLAVMVKNPVFFVSPWLRTSQTYNQISSCFANSSQVIWTYLIKEHDRNLNWHPINFLKFLAHKDIQRSFESYKDIVFEGGETLAETLERAERCLNLLKNTEAEEVVMVSHGQFLKLLVSLIDGVHPDKIEHQKNCEIVIRTINA